MNRRNFLLTTLYSALALDVFNPLKSEERQAEILNWPRSYFKEAVGINTNTPAANLPIDRPKGDGASYLRVEVNGDSVFIPIYVLG